MTNNFEPLFMYILAIHTFSFVKWLFKIFGNFLLGCLSSCYWLAWVLLYILHASSLSDICFANIFSLWLAFSYSFFKFIYLFIYLCLCWVFVSVWGLPLVAASGGHSSSRCAGLSLSQPLLLRSTGSRRAGSVIVAHRPSCSVACGIFPDQGSNPCLLHWQADSQPLRHQGSPLIFLTMSFDEQRL